MKSYITILFILVKFSVAGQVYHLGFIDSSWFLKYQEDYDYIFDSGEIVIDSSIEKTVNYDYQRNNFVYSQDSIAYSSSGICGSDTSYFYIWLSHENGWSDYIWLITYKNHYHLYWENVTEHEIPYSTNNPQYSVKQNPNSKLIELRRYYLDNDDYQTIVLLEKH